MHTDDRSRAGAGRREFQAAEAPVRQPVPAKGRGALDNLQGRFERLQRSAEDDGWFGDDGAPPPRPTPLSFEQARPILSRNASPDVPFELAINPYRGCEHGCSYCYARPGHGYLGLSPGLDFETRLFAKANAAECLAAELASPAHRCSPINIGSATDAYQPVEREQRITRAVLQVLADCAHPLSIVTKSALVERDIDLLAPMGRAGLAAVYVSITTLDPVLARRWEPRAAAPWRRLETVRRLSEAGIPVGVSISPLVPFINEPELERILAAAREAGAAHAFYTVLRLPWELRQMFSDWLQAWYPDRAERVLSRLADMRDPGRGAGPSPPGLSPPGLSSSRPGQAGPSQPRLNRPRLNDPRFHTRMKGQGHWADLVGLRFGLAVRKLGLNRGRLDLRTDLFVPPSADGQLGLFAPSAATVEGRPAAAAAITPKGPT